MRLEKLENLFDLALEMHVKRQGISLQMLWNDFLLVDEQPSE